VTEPPLALRDRTVAVLVFDSSKAPVVAGARTPEEVAELKRTAGKVLAESIALRMKVRLHARADVVSSVPEDAEYVVTGKIIEIDPGNSTLRVAAGVATAFGVPASGGAGTFRASGEVLRVSGKKLVRVAEFEHASEVRGGAFSSDGEVVRAGSEDFAIRVANFFEDPKDNSDLR
jgi:hypothetical protein